MLECAATAGLPARAAAIMPIALSTFHFGAAIAQTVGALFVARVYDIPLAPLQLASMMVAVFFSSIAVPGVPGGSIIAMTPVLLSAGLPPEGLGILLAVDAVPDMFRTAANVTGAMTLTAGRPYPPRSRGPPDIARMVERCAVLKSPSAKPVA
jgi:Na+/H+-dicarboxylate symporter